MARMTPEEMKARTKAFAVAVVKVVERLPRTLATQRIAIQLVDAAGSTAANYRSACRGRSRAEFLAKLGIVEEEADEAEFWLELLVDAGLLDASTAHPLRAEAHEIVAIVVRSVQTARANGSHARPGS